MSEIESSDHVDVDIEHFLEKGLSAHGAAHLGDDAARYDLQLVIRDADGGVCAGLTGMSQHGMFKVKLLWVREDVRGHKFGVNLMKQAEKAARARGNAGMLVHTYSFQGPDFYQALGFAICGVVKDHPQGHDYLWLEKRF